MKRIKKALAAAASAAVTAVASYMFTGTFERQPVEAALVALASAAVSGGLTYVVKNLDGKDSPDPKAPKGEPR